MKRKNLITIAIVGILAIGGLIVFDYFSLENQILRDIDEFYETGGDYELGTQIMNKIDTLARNDGGRDGKNAGERFNRFIQNPKVQRFIAEWAITQSQFDLNS